MIALFSGGGQDPEILFYALAAQKIMATRPFGLVIVALGVAAVIVGLLFWAGWLSWLGRLPGDLRIERENVRVFIPFTSMILVSLVLTLILNLLRRFF